MGHDDMANIKVKTFDYDGRHWVYMDELNRALRDRVLETAIPWDKCRMETINGKAAVEVTYQNES